MKVTNSLDFQKKTSDYINLINKKIESYLDDSFVLYRQMHYCMMSGGKRIRPLLLLSVSKNLQTALPFACAIEFIHNYSLVHDDLPAMDNDDYRRGILTCHKKFGEAVAILVGDALLTLACEIVLDEPKFFNAAKKIFNAAGINGMIKGQALELESKIITADELKQIHLNKTAALIRASLEAGIILSGENENVLKNFSMLGNKLGLAFQIKDDILDKDEEKMTYFKMYGLEKSQNIFNNLADEIYSDIEKLDEQYDFFKYLVKNILERKN